MILRSVVKLSLFSGIQTALFHVLRYYRRTISLSMSSNIIDIAPMVNVKYFSKEVDEKKSLMDDCDLKKCEDCDLRNTATKLDVHIIVCAEAEPNLWPKKVEMEAGTVINLIQSNIRTLKAEKTTPIKSIKLTACDIQSKSENKVDLILYPHQIVLSIPKVNNENIVKSLISKLLDGEKIVHDSSPISWKKLILVCIHASRDAKCGQRGPQIKQALTSSLVRRNIPNSDVMVVGSSHIGGHKFAGVLIVYPEGDWYGNMDPGMVEDFVDYVTVTNENNTKDIEKMEKYFRGKGLSDW